MSKRKRTVIMIIVVELLLAGFWYYFHQLALTSPNALPGAAAEFDRTMGMVTGGLLGFSPILYLLARNRDRQDAERQARKE